MRTRVNGDGTRVNGDGEGGEGGDGKGDDGETDKWLYKFFLSAQRFA